MTTLRHGYDMFDTDTTTRYDTPHRDIFLFFFTNVYISIGSRCSIYI
jgi:hypothetical protein